MIPILSMFASDKVTNYYHSSILPRVLSVSTTDRLPKIQSQEAVGDLEMALMLNRKRVSPRSWAASEVPYQILSYGGNTINYLWWLLKPRANRLTEELSNSNKTSFNKTIRKIKMLKLPSWESEILHTFLPYPSCHPAPGPQALV